MQSITFEKLNELDYFSNESYKSLRTNIQFCGNEVRTIMLTSCTPNEGKSNVSFQLACSFAESDKKVILLDTDLRKSVLVGRYKVGRSVSGLSNYLSGQDELDHVIYQTNIENMDIIFAGHIPPNPAELLGHERFSDLLCTLKETYDYIIVDTPPLGAVIDAAIIAPKCDGAILVIENNSISRKFAASVKGQLEKSGCRILGAILNKVQMNKKGYYGKYSSKYYGKYYVNYGEGAE